MQKISFVYTDVAGRRKNRRFLKRDVKIHIPFRLPLANRRHATRWQQKIKLHLFYKFVRASEHINRRLCQHRIS
ncbi:MAG: hypothetical protein KBS41_04400, partial [Oscillospiraceae bacterium]|nr:hypothetical protein [Candidatus Equicaccousia limihippi]